MATWPESCSTPAPRRGRIRGDCKLQIPFPAPSGRKALGSPRVFGRPQLNGEGEAPRVYQHMMLRARFTAIRRIRPGFVAPFFAGTLEASSAARDQSMADAALSSSSKTWWSLRHTPGSFQSRSRRQPAAAHLLGEHLPGDAAPEHEENAGQHGSVRKRGPPALRTAPPPWKQRRDPRPQPVAHQRRRHAVLLQRLDLTSSSWLRSC